MDDTLIKQIAKEAAKEAIKEMNPIKKQSRNKKSFKDATELLESIPDLRDKIAQDKLDIADMKQEKFEKSTWHDMKRPGGPQLDDEVRHMQKIRKREREQKRTENLLRRIENALGKMKDDADYPILEMKYLKGVTIDQIADEMHYTTRTIWRRHNKIVTKLKRKLFGADALDI